jgi:hypothetical protein
MEYLRLLLQECNQFASGGIYSKHILIKNKTKRKIKKLTKSMNPHKNNKKCRPRVVFKLRRKK